MKIKHFSRQLFDFDSHYPRTIIAMVFFLTIVLCWKIFDLEMDPSVRSNLPTDHEIVKSMEKINDLFSGSDIIIVAVESDSIFSKSILKDLSSFQDSLESIDVIGKVVSIFSQRQIIPDDGGFEIEPLLIEIPEDSSEQAELKLKIKNAGILGDLVSYDYNKICFIGQITSSFDYDEFQFRKNIFRIVNRFNSSANFYVSSLPITRATTIENMQRDMRLYTPIALGLGILLLMISFRSWTGVFLPFFVVGFSTLWTFGIMAWFEMPVSFVGTLIPVILIAISNDYGIHIISHYFEYTSLNPEATRGAILKRTLKKLGLPILFAGLTTMISFLSLLSHTLPRVREMGLLISFGIFCAFLLSILLIPSVLVLVSRPTYLSRKNSFSGINRFLVNMGRTFTSYRIYVLVFLFSFSIWMSLGLNKLKIDTNPDHYFSEKSRLRIANTKISKAFGGSTQMNILIEGDVFNPKVLKNIEKLTSHIKNRHDIVTKSYSIVDIIKKMNSSFNGGDPKYEIIPDDPELISQYMFLYSITGNSEDFDMILDDIEEPTATQILLRLKEVQTFTIGNIVEDTEQFIDANFYDDEPIKLSGAATLLGVLSKLILKGQLVSLLYSMLIILIIMTLVFRSFVGGLLATLPMAVSVIMMFGLMGHLGIPLNMTTSFLTCILVGVGIDYTIHFLWHLRDHIRENDSLDDAITKTLKISGKGILFNGLSVVIGFSALLFSVFVPVKIFGILVMGSISFCLFGALATLPALTSLINPRFLYK